MFTPIWGFMIQFDEHIFQKGLVETTNQIKIERNIQQKSTAKMAILAQF